MAKTLSPWRTSTRSFVADQGTKWPKAAAKNPDEDWIHLRTTNPIESAVVGHSPPRLSYQRVRQGTRRPSQIGR